jgi:hypothetical protein
MIQFCGIFETACEIPDRTAGIIERNKKTVTPPRRRAAS